MANHIYVLHIYIVSEHYFILIRLGAAMHSDAMK